MLGKMWRNWNLCALLVGTGNGTPTGKQFGGSSAD